MLYIRESFIVIIIVTSSTLLGSSKVNDPIWPPITCHKYYDSSKVTLSEINTKCRDGTRYREHEVRLGNGRHLITDRKGCIAVSFGVLYLMHGHGKAVYYDYNRGKVGLWWNLQNIFGGLRANNSRSRDERVKRSEFVESILVKGNSCRLSRELGNRPSKENWKGFYQCIEQVWGCIK